MAQQVTIQSVTANTPVDIYYCDALSANCQYVATVSVFPFEFDVPSPEADTDFTIKIIDSEGCVDFMPIYITPTPTMSPTATPTLTPTFTPTTTQTPTKTPQVTNSQTVTPTNTTTNTATPTLTPNVVCHPIGQSQHLNSSNACGDVLTITCLYTYQSVAYLYPVLGAILYQNAVGGVLYNPYNGGSYWILMSWQGVLYAVQVGPNGEILNFENCTTMTPTPTQTATPTVTPTISLSPTRTPTRTPTQTPTQSHTQTPTPTQTQTGTPNATQTETPTNTPTFTPTETQTSTPVGTSTPTQTNTPTETVTQTPTQTQTQTQTNTPSETVTQTPTQTPSQTPPVTPTQTPSPTPESLQLDDIFYINDANDIVGYYDPVLNTINTLFNPTSRFYQDIAVTNNKLYLNVSDTGLNETTIYQYNITIQPWSQTYSTSTVFSGFFGAGLCAINDDVVAVAGESVWTANTQTLTSAKLFDLPANCYTTGDIIFNSNNNQFIISYTDDSDLESVYYVAIFDTSGNIVSGGSPTTEYKINLNNFLTGTDLQTIFGLYTYQNKIFAMATSFRSYELDFANQSVLLPGILPSNASGQSQLGASNVASQISWII